MQDQSFHALGVSSAVATALARRGITTPFPIQQLVLRDALAGRDVLGKSPTGSGKTLAFAIPLVERADPAAPLGALVLAPTRELAQQIADETSAIARTRGLRVAVAYGGMGIEKQARQAAAAHILVATPGRLEDLMARGRVRLNGVTALVLDEADRMLDLGFKPAVDRIVRTIPRARQTMVFSATLDGAVGQLADSYTSNPVRVEFAPPAEDAPVVEHRFLTVTKDDKLDELVDLLREERQLALVFVRTKRGASRLAERLERRGVRTAALHGDMTQSARNRSLARFASGHADTLVATDVAARGLDVDDITHVVNFDPPADDAGYVHRVGRTGRAGRSGTGITLVLPEQHDEVGRMVAKVGVTAECSRTGKPLVSERGHAPSRTRPRQRRGYRGRPTTR